ncbi:sulfotransferase family protein [Streptomyces himalayensis]|uniref:Sulfotransferase n=1 Tax=Streptomyces himalayensis subsp. himalayensis TaxID=2756131 RepID=A0A7W0I8Z9_9ACTN|nr:sulfotransferase [Streptomyces himalayensis]MBA2946581.1 sulfotransferase [Streptomyces himalayensis subsp. himalayensis]
MQDPRWDAVRKGLRRRGRLLGEALKPPAPKPSAAAQARPLDGIPAQRAPRPEGPAVEPARRLVESPVFLLSPVRSGSTLLRVLLNSHSRIRAPHEMHLRTLHVREDRDFTVTAMRALGLNREELEHMLWDRVLSHELERSGKDLIVDKTPANTLMWPRLRRAWPEARYIFLIRHPAAVVESLTARRQEPDLDEIHAEVQRYAERLEQAQEALDGVTVAYEDLTADPERETRRICTYLGIEWEEAMLDYGSQDHGKFRPHIGDWSEKIRSGRIQPARTATDCSGLPERLVEIAEGWGYGVSGAQGVDSGMPPA